MFFSILVNFVFILSPFDITVLKSPIIIISRSSPLATLFISFLTNLKKSSFFQLCAQGAWMLAMMYCLVSLPCTISTIAICASLLILI